MRARIRKTIDFAESVNEAQYAGASERKVKLSWAPGKVIGGENYLLQIAIPNTYFHLAVAYALLRHNGVEVGKKDFLGAINWIDAQTAFRARVMARNVQCPRRGQLLTTLSLATSQLSFCYGHAES